VLLGKRQNLFGSSLAVRTNFRNVSGLLTGNNIRLAGITVGIVKKITILNDSTVRIVMHLNRDMQPYVRKNAVASVGTDGLVGNTIVNLTAVAAPAPLIAEGDILRATNPPAIDEMLQTLSVSNKNLVGITEDFLQITGKCNGSRALWQLLTDQKVAANVRHSLRHVPNSSATPRPRPTTSATSRTASARVGDRLATY
jgi:phospholipid/cholesterol/gamma-HCH transport system substrate-binding protein